MASKGEKNVLQALTDRAIDYSTQLSIRASNGKRYMFDFEFVLSVGGRCIIEFDGRQHFEYVEVFKSHDTFASDMIKNQYCVDNNIRLFRIATYDAPTYSHIEKYVHKFIDLVQTLSENCDCSNYLFGTPSYSTNQNFMILTLDN